MTSLLREKLTELQRIRGTDQPKFFEVLDRIIELLDLLIGRQETLETGHRANVKLRKFELQGIVAKVEPRLKELEARFGYFVTPNNKVPMTPMFSIPHEPSDGSHASLERGDDVVQEPQQRIVNIVTTLQEVVRFAQEELSERKLRVLVVVETDTQFAEFNQLFNVLAPCQAGFTIVTLTHGNNQSDLMLCSHYDTLLAVGDGTHEWAARNARSRLTKGGLYWVVTLKEPPFIKAELCMNCVHLRTYKPVANELPAFICIGGPLLSLRAEHESCNINAFKAKQQ